jgi:hypothetical protein
LIIEHPKMHTGGTPSDLRMAAVHEASHLVLLRKFGGLGTARVWPIATEDRRQRTWLGECTLIAFPGSLQFGRDARAVLGVVRTPREWRVYVGCAGFVGEAHAIGCMDPHALYQNFVEAVRFDAVSPSDVALIGAKKFNRRHLAITASYVQRWWSDIEREADKLQHAARTELSPD